ncbi:hypothetical protein BaRGS_00035053 [Batillaria attramentaria]|uniref:Uncharacterized protein n=1 Tax=Batillaria attramentaria TaxID=370345 RepID=A0ABD0JFP8_9CAEN
MTRERRRGFCNQAIMNPFVVFPARPARDNGMSLAWNPLLGAVAETAFNRNNSGTSCPVGTLILLRRHTAYRNDVLKTGKIDDALLRRTFAFHWVSLQCFLEKDGKEKEETKEEKKDKKKEREEGERGRIRRRRRRDKKERQEGREE